MSYMTCLNRHHCRKTRAAARPRLSPCASPPPGSGPRPYPHRPACPPIRTALHPDWPCCRPARPGPTSGPLQGTPKARGSRASAPPASSHHPGPGRTQPRWAQGPGTPWQYAPCEGPAHRPITQTGPGPAPRITRAMRAPRSPPPCATRGKWPGQQRASMARSGATASLRSQRGSSTSRSNRRTWWRNHHAAATGPMSRPRRVLTRPTRGSFSMMNNWPRMWDQAK